MYINFLLSIYLSMKYKCYVTCKCYSRNARDITAYLTRCA